jgi:hypothetical protein
MLRSHSGFEVECPDHEGYTATLSGHDPLSEKQIGMHLGLPFAADGINIKHVVTDGDACSAEGMQEAMHTKYPSWVTPRQADTTHQGQGQFRHCVKATFSKRMFSGKTAEEKKEQHKFLGQDIKARCQQMYAVLHKSYCGDAAVISPKIEKSCPG